MNQRAQYMKMAIELSRQNMQAGRGGPFGAVVVKDGMVVGRGWNKVTSSNDPTAHAEVEAIREACRQMNTYNLAGCEIYTSCEPCPMCLSAIYWARLEKIFFANTKVDAAQIQFDDAFIYKELSIPASARSIPMEQILRDEAIHVFEEWDNKTDKIPY